MKVLFINNFDSFVWNLVEYVSIFEEDTIVLPNTTPVEEVRRIRPDAIVISPGPGNPHVPRDAGSTPDIIREFREVPILGVCLGHQAIAVAWGGKVAHAPSGPVHGKSSLIEHDCKTIFRGLPNPLEAGRYHSLIVSELPDCFEISASFDGMIMGIRHRDYPTEGIQFHPESVLTPHGLKIIENFLRL
ncbi:MAG: aminodeoxychorismate/anthranilate synthase component II [Candidatus Syntrophoarchaeum sp. WYZ-LMO15]|nr:MAG: aminodeoxychorismate/anthranilate synthase component II [Candidatus Syntrophoarchaeum sp. WYZ-LMO15]